MNRRRLLVGVGIALVVLIGIGVAGVIALPGIIRWAAVSQLGKALGRPVALDAVEVSLYQGRLALRGLRIMDRDGGPLATLERAEVRWSPRDLLRLHARIVDATLQAPTIRIVRTGPNQFNISDLMGPRAEKKASEPPALTLERFALLGGAIVIEDRTLTPARTWRVEALEFRVRGASTVAGAPPGDATLSAVAAGAPIALAVTDVRLSPMSFKATLTARDIDASLAALYLPPRSPLSPARGTLTFSATLEQTKDGSDVELEAAFTGVELHRPGQETAYLTAPAVKVKVDNVRVRSGSVELGRLAVDGGAVVLEDTRLQPVRRWQVDGIALEARNLSSARGAAPGVASARATTSGARLELWVSNARLAPLELDATAIIRNVDLSLVRLYLPPELPVQPERGVVNATVRVRHDGGGTRAGLDAGLSNIELRRPGHFVTAPAVRVNVDDVTLDGGAVAVGRVSVTGDRLTLEERGAKSKRTWPVENLVVEAKGLSSRRDAVQGVASVRATVAGAAASVFVTGARLQPLEGRATAILRNFDAALLKLYLPDEFPVQLGRGVVNATIEVGQLADATTVTADATLTGLEAQGRGAFATLGVKASSVRVAIAEGRRQGPALSVGRAELTGAGSLVDSRGAAARFDFSQLRLATENLTWPVTAPARVELSMRFQDRGELDGSGTARLTAAMPAIAWAADLALKFRGVDLTPLAVYAPAAAGLGGRVRADLTASLAYAGALTAHVKGDVGGARFALMEGDRPLLSLRSINAAGLDLQWPERLGIKQLRLREPYGLIVRDRQGAYALAARFARRDGTDATVPAPAVPPLAKPVLPAIAIGEVVVEGGSGAFVDESVTPSVRVDMPRLNLKLGNVTWPASAPVTVALDGTLPSGGSMKADGTLTAEPLSVDLTIACQEADLALIQPYLGFRARVGGRLDANLTVAGPLTPAPRVKIKGDVGLRSLDVSDGQRSVITADRLRVTGIDADWPERIAFDRVRVRRAWALIQRDEHGEFLLKTLLERPGAGGAPRPAAPAPAVPGPPAPRLEFSFREGIFDEQAATIIDARVSPPARIEVAGARLAVNDFSYPQKGPAKVAVKSPMPAGGQVEVTGTVQLEPMRLEARAVLDGVAIEPAQPYLPIEGRLAGKVTGDLAVKVAMEPVSVQVTGQARLQAFRLNDGDRAVVTVGRVETSGIAVDWPRRIALQSVQFSRPRLLVERDAKGAIRLRQLVTPRWTAAAPASQPTVGSRQAPPASAAPGPSIEIATFSLDKALARFVDYTTTPPYAEELEDLTVTFTPLTTTPGRRTRFAAAGGIGGGSFKLQGEGAYGDRSALDMKFEIHDLVVPRVNPYLDLYTAWAAQNGSLNVTGVYKLDGNQLETRHDLLVRGLEVARIDDRDEVERRVGLPFGMLVSLLKDSRGEIKLSLPVSGDLSTREFDYKEAVWAAVRNLSIRLIALPFSKIGSLFFSEDSKVKAVALAPVVFEPGTDRLGQGMDPHLEKVADFMRGAPAVKVTLEPILIEADVQALKRARVLSQVSAPTEPETLERASREFRLRWPSKPLPPTLDAIVSELVTAETLPPDAMRALATRRIEAVRQSITRGGGVDAARLPGRARGTPLVEAAGSPRVEFDLRS